MLYDVIILGGGAAGLGAALYSARYSLKTLIIAKEFGGTGNIAHKVDNWMGEPDITGPDLMDRFIGHVDKYKVPKVEEEVTEIKRLANVGFEVKAGKSYKSKAIIYALGMKHRNLNVPGEKEFTGKGVHYCYTCDGPLYSGKKLGMVGGGDAAGLGAIFLSNYAKSVDMFVRRDVMRAEPITQERLRKDKKIKINFKSEITEFIGDKRLEKIRLKGNRVLDFDGIFIEVGHIPLSDLAKKLRVKVNDHGFIEVNQFQKTNIKGFAAAGDITTKHTLKQFITSAEEGSVAAESVYRYINQSKW